MAMTELRQGTERREGRRGFGFAVIVLTPALGALLALLFLSLGKTAPVALLLAFGCINLAALGAAIRAGLLDRG